MNRCDCGYLGHPTRGCRCTPTQLAQHAALRGHCALDGEGRRLVADAVDRRGMSARGVHRALRVARTIPDLSAEERVYATHGLDRPRALLSCREIL